jgi:hypothetical protein
MREAEQPILMALFVGYFIHRRALSFFSSCRQVNSAENGVDSLLRPKSAIHIQYKQKRLGFREQDILAECSFSYEQAEKLGIQSTGTT